MTMPAFPLHELRRHPGSDGDFAPPRYAHPQRATDPLRAMMRIISPHGLRGDGHLHLSFV
jgi:hypothetical protein